MDNSILAAVIFLSVFAIILIYVGFIYAYTQYRADLRIYKNRIGCQTKAIQAHKKAAAQEIELKQMSGRFRSPTAPEPAYLRDLEAARDGVDTEMGIADRAVSPTPSALQGLARDMPRWWRWSAITIEEGDGAAPSESSENLTDSSEEMGVVAENGDALLSPDYFEDISLAWIEPLEVWMAGAMYMARQIELFNQSNETKIKKKDAWKCNAVIGDQ